MVDFEQQDADLADDGLHNIISLKEEMIAWLAKVERETEGYPKSIFSSHVDDYERLKDSAEEEFDDLFHHEWHRLTKISGSVEWDAEIPSMDTLKKRERKRLAGKMIEPVGKRFLVGSEARKEVL